MTKILHWKALGWVAAAIAAWLLFRKKAPPAELPTTVIVSTDDPNMIVDQPSTSLEGWGMNEGIAYVPTPGAS
jgi:hypothetical protein